MALHVSIQSQPFGSYTELSLETYKMAGFKLRVGYSHPAQLEFVLYTLNTWETTPIAPNKFIRFWDDSTHTSTNPTFEGWVDEVQPAITDRYVKVIAYDPTKKAMECTSVMSLPFVQGSIPENRSPEPASGAIPRVVFNAWIDTDDDAMFQRSWGNRISDIVSTIFNDQYHPLYWLNAAPGDGTSDGNGKAYVESDLLGLTYIPQEKVVFESDNIRSALDKLLQMYPNYRLIWRPGDRTWRLLNLDSVGTKTLILNKFSGTGDVLAFDVTRQVQGRYTAVKIYGPENPVKTIASTVDGSLERYGDPVTLEKISGSPVLCWHKWRITNDSKRRIYPAFAPELIQVSSYQFNWVARPTLQVSYDNGQTWGSVGNCRFDYLNGIADCGTCPYVYSSKGVQTTTGIQHYFPPKHARLIYAYPGNPISVRVPSGGYAGTSYDLFDVRKEMRLYDEALAVGYESWVPLTTASRIEQFTKLADAIWHERKDVSYAGNAVIDGLDYDYLYLNKKVNITAYQGNGSSTFTTGWENAGMVVTDVEYDYDEKVTTLTFSSDVMELMGIDIEIAKKRLKIYAMKMAEVHYSTRYIWGKFKNYKGYWVDFITGQITTLRYGFQDPYTGQKEERAPYKEWD